jgi:hypothetical protein
MKKLVSVAALATSIASALVVSLSLQAEARNDYPLRGLSHIKLLIVNAGDAATCGVTKDLVRNAVRNPASSAKFQLTDAGTAPGDSALGTLYIRTETIFFRPQKLCVTHTSMEVYTLQSLTLEFSKRQEFAEVKLLEGSALGGTDPSNPRYVAEQIEELIKQFVTDWNLANKDQK